MFRLYSKGCEYTLRALIQACSDGTTSRFLAREVCREAGVPEPSTRKSFQTLVREGFLDAVRGPGGGYVLAKAPSRVSVLDIIRAVDGEETFEGCILGLPHCGTGNPCPLHASWAEMKERMQARLQSTTLQDLADVSRQGQR